ncbi:MULTISPECIES: DUF6081 family protein [unclassified Streptomyces]|uniref:DUF6081 family protein n=1 Tax=unclassified Streptomyces TaxID=2593676 RepID=UPI000DDA9CD9|nr:MULTISPECIES: DUF6081 family protein [unclassified Streptomyces]QZZ31018.1 hypothetical protein A7X85_36530 [Streptomyces sp. ST1015]
MTTTDLGRESVYDPFEGPALDPARWFHLTFPLPDGTTFVADEPGAEITFGDGGVRVAIDRFTRGHPVQMADNCKFLVLSTEDFALPEAGRVTFSASLAAEAHGATPYDPRDGFAALVLCDPVGGRIYDLCTSGDTVFALSEQLPYPGVSAPFTRLVADPLFGPPATPGWFHYCEITVDTAARRITWRMDGRTVHEELAAELPASLKIGMGIFTVHPLTDGASTSRHGQGFTANWRDLRVRG